MTTMARGEVRQTEVRVAAGSAAVRAAVGYMVMPTVRTGDNVASSADVTRTTATQPTQISSR